MWLMLVNSIQPCPGIVAGRAQRLRYQAPGPHTDRDKRQTHIQTFAFTHVHACRQKYTDYQQTNKRLTLGVCHSAAAPVSMVTARTMQQEELCWGEREIEREVCVDVCPPVHLKCVGVCAGGCERLQRGRQPQGAETERIQKTLFYFFVRMSLIDQEKQIWKCGSKQKKERETQM